MELICIIWFNIYGANLIFWAVSMADSWEDCNYGITRAQGSCCECTPRGCLQTNAALGGPPTSSTPDLCSWSSAWATSASQQHPDIADSHSKANRNESSCSLLNES